MNIKRYPKKLIDYTKEVFNKENWDILKVVCSFILVYSSIIAIVGFFSTTNSFYVGDLFLRSSLVLLGLCFIYLLYFSFFKLNKRKEIISITIFTIILFILAYYLPMFPAQFELRDYEVDASILKFMITSIFLMVIGIVSVSFTMKPLYNFTSKSNEKSAFYLLGVAILLIIYPLIILVGNIIYNGAPGLTWDFITQDVRKLGTQGGVFPALIGTIFLMAGTALIALPLGIGCAVYLHEYAKQGIITRIIRICVDILQGTPSIVHGLFGLAVFIPMFGISLLSGVLILGFLTLPIIIRASEEALRSVPQNIREGAYAVGATKWQAIRTVVIPPALPGIITGGVLGLGRAAGETAPIMFTAVYFFGAGIPDSIFDPIQALPYHLLELTKLIGYKSVDQNAWATALLLLSIVLGINAIAIIIRERFRVEF